MIRKKLAPLNRQPLQSLSRSPGQSQDKFDKQLKMKTQTSTAFPEHSHSQFSRTIRIESKRAPEISQHLLFTNDKTISSSFNETLHRTMHKNRSKSTTTNFLDASYDDSFKVATV